MNDDLIKMLRDYPGFFGDTEALMNAAADRIAALEAALRELLHHIDAYDAGSGLEYAIAVATRALEEKD